LPPVGAITVRDPFTGDEHDYNMPGGGRGYTRVPSLVSVWSTAPLLLNNSLGHFESSPSVEARMRSFDGSIEMLLWPEKRDRDTAVGGKGVFAIDRTTEASYLTVPAGFLPDALKPLLGTLERALPAVFGEGGLRIGPVPKGTPIGLLANLMVLPDPDSGIDQLDHAKKLIALVIRLKHDLEALPANATSDDAAKVFANLAAPLLELSKCPDFEVNRGHYFGTSLDTEGPPLTDAQKASLIAFIKTF
jgi:hypothetical protein